jgi:hypothetical protein
MRWDGQGCSEDAMTRRLYGLVAALVLVGVCVGQSPKTPAPTRAPQVFTGKVVPLAGAKGKSGAKPEDRGVALKADDGTTYPLVEDDTSRMLFVDSRLQNRPVRLTAFREPSTKGLRLVRVQTVKDGKPYDVDYWCEICFISLNYPGSCVCCGDETEFRERPAK